MTKEQCLKGNEFLQRIKDLERQIESLTKALGEIHEDSYKQLYLDVHINDLSSYGHHYLNKEFARKFLTDLIEEYRKEIIFCEEELSKI